MHRNLYLFGIFFTGLYAFIEIVHSLLNKIVGQNYGELESITAWLMLFIFVLTIASVFLFKYYHHKKYWLAFWTGIMSAIIAIAHVIIIIQILATKVPSPIFPYTALAILVTGIIYSLVLIFSKAGERPWLKTVGITSLVVQIIMTASINWNMPLNMLQAKVGWASIQEWVTIAGSFIPIFVMLNFRNEIKAPHANDVPPLKDGLKELMIFGSFLMVIATLVIGTKLVAQSIEATSPYFKVTDKTRKLAAPFEARSFVNSHGDSLQYRLLLPLDYNAEEAYPIVVCLHGGGSHGHDNIRQVEASLIAQKLSKPTFRQNYKAFVFVPQCPPGTSWGGIPGLLPIDSLVFETINALEKEFNINSNRRYVSGLSMGGYGAWHFITSRPEFFAAALPICGGGDPNVAHHAADVSVWAFHGELDKNVPVALSRNMIEAIKEAGGNPKYTEYPNLEHNIWNEVNNTPGLLNWLFAQERDSVFRP